MDSSLRVEPCAEESVAGPLSPPWPWTFLSLSIATTHLPRAGKNLDTARDNRQNRSATPGPLAPREKKSQVRRTCRTRDRDARESRSASLAGEAWMPVLNFSGPARAAYASAAPALGSPTDRFALVNSPARRFLAA